VQVITAFGNLADAVIARILSKHLQHPCLMWWFRTKQHAFWCVYNEKIIQISAKQYRQSRR